jgi:hypothetical protein
LLGGQFASQHKVLPDLELYWSIPSFGGRSQWDLEHPWGLI